MKQMQEGGFQSHPLMRATIGLTLALLLGFWLTSFAMYFSRMGLRPASVVSYYNGSEEDFRPPRSAASMLETTHAHLPMMGMVLLFLTHLAIFVPILIRCPGGIVFALRQGVRRTQLAGPIPVLRHLNEFGPKLTQIRLGSLHSCLGLLQLGPYQGYIRGIQRVINLGEHRAILENEP